MTITPLNVVRSDAREVMARRVESIAAGAEALCVRTSDDLGAPGSIRLRISAPGGLTVHLAIAGEDGNRQALHFLHWKMESDSCSRLHPRFGGVNTHHFRDATHVAYSFEALCEQLSLSLQLAAGGEAFEVTRTPVQQRAESRCASPRRGH